MKILWLGYLVYSLSNCAMKLCIETGLIEICTVWRRNLSIIVYVIVICNNVN